MHLYLEVHPVQKFYTQALDLTWLGGVIRIFLLHCNILSSQHILAPLLELRLTVSTALIH